MSDTTGARCPVCDSDCLQAVRPAFATGPFAGIDDDGQAIVGDGNPDFRVLDAPATDLWCPACDQHVGTGEPVPNLDPARWPQVVEVLTHARRVRDARAALDAVDPADRDEMLSRAQALVALLDGPTAVAAPVAVGPADDDATTERRDRLLALANEAEQDGDTTAAARFRAQAADIS